MVSKLHIKLGEILRNSEIFKRFKIYEEYPVKKINPKYNSAQHRFDWIIMDIFLVIECHGKQHYQPVEFGGIDSAISVGNFHSQRIRDRDKMQAALDVGFTYIEISYNDYNNITDKLIWEKYQESLNTQETTVPVKQKKQNREILNKAKEIRSKLNKQYYQLIKQRRRFINEEN